MAAQRINYEAWQPMISQHALLGVSTELGLLAQEFLTRGAALQQAASGLRYRNLWRPVFQTGERAVIHFVIENTLRLSLIHI